MPEVTGRVDSAQPPGRPLVKPGDTSRKTIRRRSAGKPEEIADANWTLRVQPRARQSELIKVSGISQSDYDQAVLQGKFDKRGYRHTQGADTQDPKSGRRSMA